MLGIRAAITVNSTDPSYPQNVKTMWELITVSRLQIHFMWGQQIYTLVNLKFVITEKIIIRLANLIQITNPNMARNPFEIHSKIYSSSK